MNTIMEKLKKSNKPSSIIIAGILAAVIVLQSIILIYFILQGVDIYLPDPPLGDFINVQDKGAQGKGSPDDAKAITLAFNEAQTKGMDLYFPAGTYNFNNLNLIAKQNIRIYGDGESTILYNPGQISCYNDAAVENLSIYKSTGIFIYMRPDGYSNLLVDRVKVYNDMPMASEDCRPFYACINVLDAGRGIDNITFTNNSITKCQTGLMLQCEVKSGLIDNNVITKIGTTSVSKQTYGITVGTVGEANKWICANNIIISNNVIEDVYSPDKPITNVYAILATGYNIQILNNTVKNQVAFTGTDAKVSDLHSAIYAKASDLLIKGNTIINAGVHSSICVKNNPLRRPDDDRTDNNIIVEDNIISTSVDAFGGIRFEAMNFTVRNNTIELFAPNDDFLSSTGITARDLPIQWAVIEGNTIYSEARNAIILEKIPGKVTISNNTIKQKMVAADLSEAGVFALRNGSAETIVECTGNTIDIERGRHILYGVKLPEGSTMNFSGNTVSAKAFNNWLLYMDSMTCNMTDNTFTINDNPEFYSNDIQKRGLLSGGATAKPYRIERNNIYCNSGNTSYLFQMPSTFSMTGNHFTFSPDSKLSAILTYNPTSQADSGMTSTISNNTIGTLTDVLSGGDITNTDYFVRFYTAGAYPFPRLNISNNSAIVNMRLVQRSSASIAIASDGPINISDNLIYSALYGADAAVIDPKIKEGELKLIANTSLAEQVANIVKEAERVAAEAAEAAAKEAAAKEAAAAAEAAAKAAAEEAARLAAEKEAAELAAAEAAAKEAEAAAQAEAEAAAKAAAEEAARLAAEAEAAAAAAAEEERLAAEAEAQAAAAEAARLAAEAEAAEAACLAAEEAAKAAAEEAARLAAEAEARAAAEEAARLAAEEAAAEAARLEAEAAAEAARLAAEEARREAEAAAKAAAEQAEREAAERAAAQEEADRLAAEAAAKAAAEEEARRAAEQAAAKAAEEAAAKAAAEEAAKAAAEAAEKEKEAEKNKEAVIPAAWDDFIFYSTKENYLILQFNDEVKGDSDKCVSIDGKTYNTKQYDKNSILVNVKTNTSQLNSSFKVTAKVLFPSSDNKKVQTLTKTFKK